MYHVIQYDIVIKIIHDFIWYENGCLIVDMRHLGEICYLWLPIGFVFLSKNHWYIDVLHFHLRHFIHVS